MSDPSGAPPSPLQRATQAALDLLLIVPRCRPQRSVLLALVAVMLANHPAAAQICIGASPFSYGHIRAGATLGSTVLPEPALEGASSLGAQLALGTVDGLFATVASVLALQNRRSRFELEGLADSSADDTGAIVTSFLAGYVKLLSETGSVQACPIVGLSLQRGPGLWRDCTPRGQGIFSCTGAADGRALTFWVGGSIGRTVGSPEARALVPFVGVAYASSRMTLSTGPGSLREDYVGITIGAGLVSRRVTVRPVFSIPLGVERGDLGGGLEVTVSFWRPRL